MAANSLAAGIAALAKREGANPTRYAGATLWNVTVPEAPTPTFYPSSIILVGSGEKRGFLGDAAFVYDAKNYLVVTAPLPMLCQTLASPRAPVRTMMIDIDLELLRELLLGLDELGAATRGAAADRPRGAGDDGRAPNAATKRSVFEAPLTPQIEAAGGRLLEHLRDDRATKVLARATVRELMFHVLDGPYGDALRALSYGPTGQLSRVMRYLSDRFAEHIAIEDLARQAHMSVPTFHHHFKQMTATSPLQYLKALRLTRAKQLLQGGMAVKTAAKDVGYESESQFSREFRRFFGAPPSTIANRRRA